MKLKKGKRYVEINNENIPIENVDKDVLKNLALLPVKAIGFTETKTA